MHFAHLQNFVALEDKLWSIDAVEVPSIHSNNLSPTHGRQHLREMVGGASVSGNKGEDLFVSTDES